MQENVHKLTHHPKKVIEKIRALAANLPMVDYNTNLNDLVQARQVSMRAIWTCLEEGEIVPGSLHHEPNGTYATLSDVVAGVQVNVDILIEEGNGVRTRLIILWTEEFEEE